MNATTNGTNATAATSEAAPAAPAAREGFGSLPCPKCLQEATIDLRLEDLDTCKCAECEEEFTIGDVRNVIEQWAPVLAWLDARPERPRVRQRDPKATDAVPRGRDSTAPGPGRLQRP